MIINENVKNKSKEQHKKAIFLWYKPMVFFACAFIFKFLLNFVLKSKYLGLSCLLDIVKAEEKHDSLFKMFTFELWGKICTKKRAVTKTYNVTSRYVLQTKFFSKPMEGSAVMQEVGFTQVGLRLGSEETVYGRLISKR